MKKPKNLNTEEKILEAAKTIFMKYGLYGARMQDIADTAGINKALLHYYFRSKDKLFDHVFEGALSKYFEQMDVFSDTSRSVIDRIFQYIDNIIDFLSEYPQMSMFIIKEVSTHPELFKNRIAEIKKGRGSKLIEALQEAISKDEIPPIDPVMFLFNMHSLCAYPFLAAPIFQRIVASNNLDWTDPNNLKLKESVKQFVEFKLGKNNTAK